MPRTADFTSWEAGVAFLRDLDFLPILHGRNDRGFWRHIRFKGWRATLHPVLLPYACARMTYTVSDEALWTPGRNGPLT